MRAEIIEHIESWSAQHDPLRWSDERFNALAIKLFTWQLEHNAPYRRYCERQGIDLATITDYRQIPAVPTDVFKLMPMSCWPEATRTFLTSGTTAQGQRGQHPMASVATYQASIYSPFERLCLTPHDKMRLLILATDEDDQPESSLSFMLTRFLERYGAPGSRFFFSRQSDQELVFDHEALIDALDDAQAQAEPVFLLGTAFAFMALFDHPQHASRTWRLPQGSRLLETGGFKGRSREVSRAELYALFEQRLGLSPSYCVSEYSMTELSAQAYTDNLRAHLLDPTQNTDLEHRRLRTPPWARVEVADPLTLKTILEPHVQGLLRWYDLSNTESVLAVQTSDMGYIEDDGGFVLLGRAPDSELRGCSLAVEELLPRTEP